MNNIGIYHSVEGDSNKVWQYKINADNSVLVEWGRVGLDLQSQIKTFNDRMDAESFVEKKLREKVKKGYKESSQKQIKQEAQTAQELGTQYKISKMCFVDEKGKKLTRLSGYDPKKFVYVEVKNSWDKEITRLLLSTAGSWEITEGVTEIGQTLTYGNKHITSSHFVTAIRNVLKRLSAQVVEVIKTIKFAAVGARKLFDDDVNTAESASAMTDLLSQVDSAGVDASVVKTFAAMGSRVLEL